MAGATNYPTSADDFATTSPSELGDDDAKGRTHSERHDDMEAAMEAVQASLLSGTGALNVTLQAGAAVTPSLQFTSDTNTGIWSPGADTLAVSTGGTERLRVNSSGNVGLGTDSPSVRLDVSGSMTITGGVVTLPGASSTTPSLTTSGDSNTGLFFPAADAVAITTGGTERVRVDSAGLLTGSGSLGAWTSWSPSYSNVTVGDGTVLARYKQVGKIVHAHFRLTLGSTSSIGTDAGIVLPLTLASNQQINGTAWYFDTSASFDAVGGVVNNRIAAGTLMFVYNGTGAAASGRIGATVPFTWTTGDAISCTFTYEIA